MGLCRWASLNVQDISSRRHGRKRRGGPKVDGEIDDSQEWLSKHVFIFEHAWNDISKRL